MTEDTFETQWLTLPTYVIQRYQLSRHSVMVHAGI
jgi:hypothetical protein